MFGFDLCVCLLVFVLLLLQLVQGSQQCDARVSTNGTDAPSSPAFATLQFALDSIGNETLSVTVCVEAGTYVNDSFSATLHRSFQRVSVVGLTLDNVCVIACVFVLLRLGFKDESLLSC